MTGIATKQEKRLRIKPHLSSICVIIINYFDHISTQKCVDSVIGQKFDTLYLVDNSGDKNEARLTQKIKNSLDKKKLPFHSELLINSKNLGFGAGINAAVKADISKTGGHGYYLLLNNDAVLTENTIQIMAEKCVKNPDIALASPLIDWGGKPLGYYGYNKLFGHVTSSPTPFSKPYLSGCCLLVSHVLISDQGNIFDEDFFMYGEDIELNWRAKDMGKNICCIDDVRIYHQGSGSSNHGEYFYEYHVARGHFLLGIKASFSEKKITIYTMARIFYLSVRALIRYFRFSSFIPIYATVSAFINVMINEDS